ncbi:hypothetical protein [Selenomonas artemidis]|uniref:hypothetical protein n=1 Tax=Selenomonas artemidis TaxID=671224 RepID=UPI0028D33DCB|nr:hypothetical protein [Selenomonas artemidis]
MTAKEYLWRVRDAERELKLLEQEYEQAKADILHLKAIQYDADKITGGKIGDLSDAIAVLEGYAERVNAKWDKLIALRNEVGALIEQIADGRYREVLKRRYLWGESWEYIAVGMGYSFRQVTRLHGGALRAIAEKMS